MIEDHKKFCECCETTIPEECGCMYLWSDADIEALSQAMRRFDDLDENDSPF